MTQEEKELLLRDLSARLPYGVICEDIYGNVLELNGIDKPNTATFKCSDNTFWTTDLDKCKPYLFPLSSITEEQEKELSKLGVSYGEYALHDDTRGLGIMVDEAYVFFEFCYKHHIDFLGLIEIGLAIDATGLDIY